MSSFCSAKATHIFLAKHITILCIESIKTVNEMTLNELLNEQLGPDCQGCKVSSPGDNEDRSDCADVHANLNLHWAHMSCGGVFFLLLWLRI